MITKILAERELQTVWEACGFREYRKRMGRWCSITKNLCGYGEWDDVCERYGLSLRTTNDWIRDFEDEMTWQAQDQAIAAKKSAESADSPAPETYGTSVYAVTGAPQARERTPDPDNDNREENKEKERSKRKGKKPTPHKNILTHSRRNVDPLKLAIFYRIREAHVGEVKAIMDRKMDEAMAEVLALDPEVAQPGIMRVLDVRSILRNQEYTDAEISQVTLDASLNFDAMLQNAFKQVKSLNRGKEDDKCTHV